MRDLKLIVRLKKVNCCCPGHDTWPNDTYRSRLSKKARSRFIKKEHRYVRRQLKQQLSRVELNELY